MDNLTEGHSISMPTHIVIADGSEYTELGETAPLLEVCTSETDPMADVDIQTNLLEAELPEKPTENQVPEEAVGAGYVTDHDFISEIEVSKVVNAADDNEERIDIDEVAEVNPKMKKNTEEDADVNIDEPEDNLADADGEINDESAENLGDNKSESEDADAEKITGDIDNQSEDDFVSNKRAGVNKDDSVDEQQCRVCQSKLDLVSLFEKFEEQTPAEMLLTICPKLSIALQDFMPQYICNTCLDNAIIATQLKAQLETTENELRKKLSRSKNKVRRPKGYIVIDAPDSDPPSEEEPNDDVEFKVSDIEVASSAESDTDESDFSSRRKRTQRGSASRRGRRKVSGMSTSSTKSSTKRNAPSSEGESEDDCAPSQKKRPGHNQTDLVCEYCNRVFKIKRAYLNHLAKHRGDNSFKCMKCKDIFQLRSEMLRHMADAHDEMDMLYDCKKCHRKFVSESGLSRHKNGHCPGAKKNDTMKVSYGPDLFKAVAPLTTTYWSDSFSD